MELSTREESAHEGSGHVDTVGVRGSNPLPRTITGDNVNTPGLLCVARESELTSTGAVYDVWGQHSLDLKRTPVAVAPLNSSLKP